MSLPAISDVDQQDILFSRCGLTHTTEATQDYPGYRIVVRSGKETDKSVMIFYYDVQGKCTGCEIYHPPVE